jgi:hypothetical protein
LTKVTCFGYASDMDFDDYRAAYFVDPAPPPRFQFGGLGGVSLYIEAYDEAVAFYSAVLGPPAYVEGRGTRGWPIGADWLTLFKAVQGTPANMDVTITMQSAAEVETLYRAFIDAGATGEPPSDQLMYSPVRYASVTDPFGAVVVIISPLIQE